MERRQVKQRNKKGEPSCTHCKKEGPDEEHCWKLHLELKPKKFGGKGNQKIIGTSQQYLASDSGDEKKITIVGV